MKVKILDLILSMKNILTTDDKALYTAVWSIEDSIKKIEEKDGVLLETNLVTEYLNGEENIEVIFTNEETKKVLSFMKDKWIGEMNKLDNNDESIKVYKKLISLVNRLLKRA